MPEITEQELQILLDHLQAGRDVAEAWAAAGGVAVSHETMSPNGPLGKALARLASAQRQEATLRELVDRIRAKPTPGH